MRAKAPRMRKLNSYGVLIVRGDPIESFLLMRHRTRYDVPKGHIDPGETQIECALRELEEETGITPDDIELDTDFCFSSTYEVQPKKFNFETCQKTTAIFLGRLLHDVEIKVTEHDGHEWRKWEPPHSIQREMIDPLLMKLEEYLSSK